MRLALIIKRNDDAVSASQWANQSPHTDLPPVKPSAIAVGLAFNQGIELAVLSPIFGQTYQRAKSSDTKEEFLRSKEASGAAAAWGTSFVGAALQSYGVGALINATGTLSYKGAAYLGSLIFAATAAPGVSLPFLSHRLSMSPGRLSCPTNS
jgi:hypothetical protein